MIKINLARSIAEKMAYKETSDCVKMSDLQNTQKILLDLLKGFFF